MSIKLLLAKASPTGRKSKELAGTKFHEPDVAERFILYEISLSYSAYADLPCVQGTHLRLHRQTGDCCHAIVGRPLDRARRQTG